MKRVNEIQNIFTLLEKSRLQAKTCNVLIKDDGTFATKDDDILSMQRQFYKQLYTLDPKVAFETEVEAEAKIPDEIKMKHEEHFSMEEMGTAIKDMKNGRVPGPDGIPVDFYKMFYSLIREDLYAAIMRAQENQQLHTTASRGVLSLIPKANRDTRILKNLRPITLLNTDYKIIEKMIANRIVPQLNEIIGTNQRGFIPGRRIAVNIRKMFDVVLEAENSRSPVIILQADMAKAFDKVEMCAIKGNLRFFGFADYLINWLDVLYKDFKVRVQNNGHLSSTIDIQRSVHQGAPCSAAIFVCVIEMLALDIRADSNIKGAFIKEIENILNQYADDTDFSLDGGDSKSLLHTIEHIERFKNITGLDMNYDKTNIYRVGSLRNTDAQFYTERKINWTNDDVINVLGVQICADLEKAVDLNYEKITEKAKATLNNWRRRPLSLCGKIEIINSLVGSLFVYCMTVLPPIPEKHVKNMESIMEKFIWKCKKPKVPIRILQGNKKEGGLSLVNLRKKDKALKAGWIKTIHDDTEIAEIAHSLLSKKLGFLLWQCNIKREDIAGIDQICTDNRFWKSVLHAWCEYSYVPWICENQIIWCNSNIKVAGQTVFWSGPMQSGLMNVGQLFQGGKYITQQMAMERYGLTAMQYNSLISSVLKGEKHLCEGGKNCSRPF